MRVGVDSGTTLVKFAWDYGNKDDYRFEAVGNDGQTQEVVKRLVDLGARQANIIGIGNRKGLQGLDLVYKDNELKIQADGAKRLLALSGSVIPKEFFLASVGTGTSYVIVRENGIEKLPFGRPLGGGFILGLSRAFQVSQSFGSLDGMVGKGVPLDVFDLNDPNLVVANFAKARFNSSTADIAATIFHCVAVNIAQDVAMMGSGLSAPRHVVYIGMPIATSYTLRTYLQHYSMNFKFTPIFPSMFAGYAGALGALHMND